MESPSSPSDKIMSVITSGNAPCVQQAGGIIIKKNIMVSQTTGYLRRGIITTEGLGDIIPPISQWLIEHQLHYSRHLFNKQI
jgi:hypothetical protein